MATFETSKQAVLDRINTLASSSSTTAEDSIYLAKALREAAADIAFVWRGPWTSTYTYVLGDVVQHDGNAYICINAHVAAVTFDSASGSWQTMVVGGAQWFTGNTVPANSSGEDGDWFFNSADEKIHNRQSGTWVSIADLGGSIWTSSVGVGTGGEDGDFHFNETTQEISKRSSGTWTVLADLTPLNMSSAEVKTAYEANADTNEFSDAEQTKLAGIEAGSNLIINNNQIANGAGYITVGLPTGGTVGQVVTNTAAGAGNWQDSSSKLLQMEYYPITNANWQTTSYSPVLVADNMFFQPMSSTSKLVVTLSNFGYLDPGHNDQWCRLSITRDNTDAEYEPALLMARNVGERHGTSNHTHYFNTYQQVTTGNGTSNAHIRVYWWNENAAGRTSWFHKGDMDRSQYSYMTIAEYEI